MIYHTEEELIKASGPEQWRHFIINTGSEYKLHDWYSISSHGRVASHIARRHKGKGLRGYDRVIDHNQRRIMTTQDNTCVLGHKRISYVFPKDFFDYDYASCNKSKDTVLVKFYTHQLLMWAFNPISGDPPELIADVWDDIPEKAQIYIDSLLMINHKNHNPGHNYLPNLERCRQKENSRAARDYYGGNVVNKSKMKTPKGQDLIVKPVEEPKSTPLQLFYA